MLKDKPTTPTRFLFCPPQLHLNLGMAAHLVEDIQRVDAELCAAWEDEIGVTRDNKRGDKRTWF